MRPPGRVLARAGQVIVCERDHVACDVVEDLATGSVVRSAAFANWRSGATPAPHSRFPRCHVCGGGIFEDTNPALTARRTAEPQLVGRYFPGVVVRAREKYNGE